MANFKRIISFILVFAIVVSVLVFSLSASAGAVYASHSPDLTMLSAVSYTYEHTALTTHKTNGYDYNHVSGTARNTVYSFGLSGRVVVNYSYSFKVSDLGGLPSDVFGLAVSFVSTSEVERVSIYLDGGDYTSYPVFTASDSSFADSSGTVSFEAFATYYLTVVVVLDFRDAADISYDFDFAFFRDGVDDPPSGDSSPYFLLHHVGEDGSLWYLYHGISTNVPSASFGTNNTSYFDVSGDGSSLTITSVPNPSNYSTSGWQTGVDVNFNLDGLVAPVTGRYDWYFYSAPTSYYSYQANSYTDITSSVHAIGIRFNNASNVPIYSGYSNAYGGAYGFTYSNKLEGDPFIFKNFSPSTYWLRRVDYALVQTFQLFAKVTPASGSSPDWDDGIGVEVENPGDGTDPGGDGSFPGADSWLGNILNAIYQKLVEIHDAIENIVVDITNNISGGGSSGDAKKGFFARLWEIIEDAILDVLNAIIDFLTGILKGLLDALLSILEGLWDILSGAVLNGLSDIGDFFDLFSSDNSPVFDFFKSEEGENIWASS